MHVEEDSLKLYVYNQQTSTSSTAEKTSIFKSVEYELLLEYPLSLKMNEVLWASYVFSNRMVQIIFFLEYCMSFSYSLGRGFSAADLFKK